MVPRRATHRARARQQTLSAALAALLIVCVCFGLGGCTPRPPVGGGTAPPPPSGGAGDQPPPTPPTPPVLAERPVNVGRIEVVYPDDAELVDIRGWGPAPVNQLWVYLQPGQDRDVALDVAAALGGTVIGEIAALDAYQIQTPDTSGGELSRTIARAEALEQVEWAMPHHKATFGVSEIGVSMCDPIGNANYQGLHSRPYAMIGLADAWRMVRASGLRTEPVTVGVLDSAIWLGSGDLNHRDGPRTVVLDHERDAAPSPESDQDGTYALTHGTKVTHIIAADHRVGGPVGVAAVLGDRLTIAGMNLFDGQPKYIEVESDEVEETMISHAGSTFVVQNLVYTLELVAAGATVINCSFGPELVPLDDPLFAEKVQRLGREHDAWRRLLRWLEARQPLVLVVAAAGNDNMFMSAATGWGIPVGNLITVGSCDLNGHKAPFSNKSGTSSLAVDLAAPGTSIVVGVTTTGGSVASSGTSLSAPMVTGAAALLRSIKGDLTATQIKSILAETAARSIRNTADTEDVAIPAAISGRLLRVDNAVLHTINLVRTSKGQPSLTREELLALGGFTATVTGGPEEYTVRATVTAVGEVQTSLTLELVDGGAHLNGQATQTLSAPGDVAWTLRRTGTDRDLLTLKVERMPSEVCAIVRVPYVEPSRLGNTTAISVKANVDFARPATPSTYDSGTILTIDIPLPRPEAGYTHTFAWDGALLTAEHAGENPTTFVTETITAEAAPDGASLLWLELRREERSKAGPLSTWSRRVTLVRFADLPLSETGTAYTLQLDRDALAGRVVESYRRTEDAGGAVLDSWIVMRCNSLTVQLTKVR